MKTILAAATVVVIFVASGAAASPAPSSVDAPEAIAPAAGIFAELTDLGYDLGKFKPNYAGRFPYR